MPIENITLFAVAPGFLALGAFALFLVARAKRRIFAQEEDRKWNECVSRMINRETETAELLLSAPAK